VTNDLVVLVPTSLVIRHTAVASPTLPFTYTVSAPPHALYATHAITASGTGEGQLSAPAATATDAQGNVYVVDGGNSRIQKFDSAGNFLLAWGSNGAADGQFNGVNDIALDSAGNVWVADQNNNRLQKFDGQGNFLQAVGTAGSGNGEFLQPWGLAIAPDDTIYVVDHFNNRIQHLDETGAYLEQWDGTAGGGTQFFIPYRVALAPDGSVYVSDFNGVQKFTATGTFIAQVGTAGMAAGQLNNPVGLAVDEAGNLYVTDTVSAVCKSFLAQAIFWLVLGGWATN
jgi:tripartite motif-containing protein 71